MNFQAAQGSSSSPSEMNAALLDQVTQRPQFYSVPIPQLTLVRPGPAVASSDWSISSAKRLMDIAGAVIALILLAPVFLLVALLVAFSSDGPVMFKQRRIGRLGELFTIYKFRTMRLTPHRPAPAITQCGDARITPIGRVLRRFKIDEMPQFYNVLRGDMSLVGPRPKLPQHETMHMPFRPGITGAATLAFRSEEEMLRYIPEADLEFFCTRTIKPLKASLDSEYMQRASLFSDLAMLLTTVASCVLPRRYHPLLNVGGPDLGTFDLERLDLSTSDPC